MCFVMDLELLGHYLHSLDLLQRLLFYSTLENMKATSWYCAAADRSFSSQRLAPFTPNISDVVQVLVNVNIKLH